MAKCTSLEQIESTISELFKNTDNLLYRGHDHDLSPCATNGCPQAGVPQQDKKCECDRFVMVPSLYRMPNSSIRVSDPEEVKGLERDLIKNTSAYDGGFSLGLQKIEFIQQLLNKSSFLDVCHNLYPAIFFACYSIARWTGISNSNQNNDASIFLIDRNLNKLVQVPFEIRNETKVSRLIDIVNRYDNVCFYWDPNNRFSDIDEERRSGILDYNADTAVGNESLAQSGAFLGGQANAFKNLKYKEIIIDGKSKQKIVEQLKDKGIDWSIMHQIDKCHVVAKKILFSSTHQVSSTHQDQNIEFLSPYHVINHRLKGIDLDLTGNETNQYENSIKIQSNKMRSILRMMGDAGILSSSEIEELQNLNTIYPLLDIKDVKAFLYLDTNKKIDNWTSIAGVNKFLLRYICNNISRSEKYTRSLQEHIELFNELLGDKKFTNLDKVCSLLDEHSVSCWLDRIKNEMFHESRNLRSFQDRPIKDIIGLWNICRAYCAFNIMDKLFLLAFKDLVNFNVMINNDEKLKYFYDLFVDKFILSTEDSPLPEIYDSMPEIKMAHQKDGYIRADADPEYSIEIISDLCDYLYRNEKYAEASRLTRIFCAQLIKCYKVYEDIQDMPWIKNKTTKSELNNCKLNALRLSICHNTERNIRIDNKFGIWAILCGKFKENDEFTNEVARISISSPSIKKMLLKFGILPPFFE